jgi:hypothetical protein
MDILKALKACAVYADDTVEEALEQEPSPERAALLTQSILDKEAVKRVTEMVLRNADFPWDDFIEGKDTFDDRFPDLYVEEIIDMGDGDFQLNGRDLNRRRVWQSIYLRDVKFMRRQDAKVQMPPE